MCCYGRFLSRARSLFNLLCDDVSPEILSEMKEGFYQTKVIISELEAKAIEEATRDQAGSDQWRVWG